MNTKLLLSVPALLAAGAIAQVPTITPAAPPHQVFSYSFISSEGEAPGKVVKGAPYSADAVTETTQTLPDGNRIVRKTSSATYRDSEGRTRRELTLPAIGPLLSSGDVPKIVTIHDPVAGTTYTLHAADKTARKMPTMAGLAGVAGDRMFVSSARVRRELKDGEGARTITLQSGAMPPIPPLGFERVPSSAVNGGKPESLGKRNIEGVEATGTRYVQTIPTGEIGNERPIEMITERWYSDELQTTVMTRSNDPRIGETVYKLTNLRRGDPSRSLFEVPSDYTIADDSPNIQIMRKSKP